MGKALEIFKKAGLEDILQPALIGAGVGGLGMGAASYFNNDDPNATTGDKLRKSLGSAAKGALLGGGAGAAYGSAKDAFNVATEVPTKIQQIQQAAANKGQTLDDSPYATHHGIGSAIGSVAKAPWYYATGAGAAHDLLKLKAENSTGRELFNKAFAGANDKMPKADYGNSPQIPSAEDVAHQVAASRVGGKDLGEKANRLLTGNEGHGVNMNVLERIAKHFSGTPSQQGGFAAHGVGRENNIANLDAIVNKKGIGARDPSHWDNAREIADRIDNPKLNAAQRYMFGGKQTWEQDWRGSPMEAAKGSLKNFSKNPSALRGAAGGYLLQKLLGGAFNSTMNASYSPEQLQLWNELAKQGK